LGASLVKGVGRIGPEVFGQVPVDGLKFFALYQRYDSLGETIAELGQSFTACCLAHNDLKLNNLLLPANWEQAHDGLIQLRFIDWERSSWGDPAFDLGSLIASYLGLWLGSFAASKSMGIEETLRLAITPLESLQPSIAAFIRAYVEQFPEILETRPDFLQRVTQFAGLGLIQTIQSVLQYQKTFGNSGICMLQAAKTLLCRPEASIATISGVELSELVRPQYAAV
jgi:5-methylthioribose kinase